MFVYVRNKGEKQYHGAYRSDQPHISPKKGWRKGMKYTTWTGEVYIIDTVDVSKSLKHGTAGELKLYATRVK